MNNQAQRDTHSDPVSVMQRNVPERINSKELLRNQTELIIEHEGREYRLRLTQNGKLILTA